MREIRVPLVPASLRWAAVLTVAAVIFYLSIISPPPVDPVIEPPELIPLDKWRHFLAYAAFGATLAYATTDWGWSNRRLAAVVLATTVVYGVGIEVWQGFVPDRYFSVGDAYANALGAVLVSPYYLLRSRLSFVPLGTWARSLRT